MVKDLVHQMLQSNLNGSWKFEVQLQGSAKFQRIMIYYDETEAVSYKSSSFPIGFCTKLYFLFRCNFPQFYTPIQRGRPNVKSTEVELLLFHNV